MSFAVCLTVILYSGVKLFTAAVNDDDDDLYMQELKNNYINYAPVIPEKLDFCGEIVPVENFDVREALEKELLKTMYWHSEIFIYIKRANRYFPLIRKILKENDIPEDFLYLCVTESGLDNVVSPSNAVGFWQILDGTAKDFGLEISSDVDERYNLEKATRAACEYLKRAKAKFGSWTLVAASYNAGMGRISQYISTQHQNSYCDLLNNKETGRYVFRILAFKILLTHPEDYGFCYRQKDLYPVIDTKTVNVDTTINDLISFGINHAGSYKMLKILNPWLCSTKLTVKDGKTYQITIPLENARSKKYIIK